MPRAYKPFFTIELLHNYFISNQCSGVSIVPDAATENLLAKLKVKWKQVGNKVYFLILTEAGKPWITPDSDMVLRFGMVADDYRFFNYTNLYGKGPQVYYFSNRVNDGLTAVSTNYLSVQIPAYSGSYQKGRMCTAGTENNIFEAVQSASAAPIDSNSYHLGFPGTAITDGTTYYWYNRGNTMAFVTEQDLIETAALSYDFQLGTPAASTTTVITAFNTVSAAYDILITNPAIYQSYTETVSSCKVWLQDLAAGRYKVTVNGLDKYLFVDNHRELTTGPGVIEIYTNPVATSYKVLATDGTLTSPVYTIQFANRLVYWKYIPKTAHITGTTDLAITDITYGNINFSSPVSGSLARSSKLMIPLVEGLYISSPAAKKYPQATGPPSGNLPMAQVEQLTLLDPTVTDPAAQQYVSENYLNY